MNVVKRRSDTNIRDMYAHMCACIYTEKAREREGEERDLEIKGNRDDLMTDRAVARCCCCTG